MSKIGREKTGLLDDLWKKTGCLYLSDLKQPAWRAVCCSVTGCPPQMRRNQSFSASDVCIFLSSTVLFYFYDKRVAFVTILYHLSLLSAEKKYPFGLLCLFATLAKGILSLHSCNLQSLGFGGCSFHCSTNRLQPFSMCLATR